MRFEDDNTSYNLPDIFLVGAAKSGTTTLAYYIQQHPDVAMPRKEPGFMAYYDKPDDQVPSRIRDRQVRSYDAYKRLYQDIPPDKIICDASVANLSKYEDSIHNLKEFYGDRARDLKIVAILRQPVDRSFSHYMMLVKNGYEELDFEEAIKEENVSKRISIANGYNYLGNSLYYERVKAYMEAFPQMKIYLTDDLKDSKSLAKDLFEYVGLEYPEGINLKMKLNPSGMPKRRGLIKALNGYSETKERLKRALPESWQSKLVEFKSAVTEKNVVKVKVDPELKHRLTHEYFKEDIQKLQSLIGRDLDTWLKTERVVSP
ncbi:MAG: hypothetical protein HKN45_04520 [Flavobacteriales bacterium]|nr:hypothetical protein [Flavobacteriales bacterium]